MSRQYTVIKDRLDLRDHIYRSESIGDVNTLPVEVDLRDNFTFDAFDQLQLGSCTANALAAFRMYFLGLSGATPIMLSRLFIYYFERLAEGTVRQDSGAMIVDGMKVLQQMGVCPELEDEYNIAKFTQRPSDKAIQDALQYRISAYQRIVGVNALQAALAEGKPVVAGFTVYESFESQAVATTGIAVMPKRGERVLGGHAVLIVGYKKIKGKLYFIVRNSWGTKWGDKGYFYMPVSYFTKGLVSDMWTGTVA